MIVNKLEYDIKRIAFILLPEFALMTFCCASEPLRVANRLTKKRLYHCKFYSIDGRAVISSNSMINQVDGNIAQITDVDMLVVVSSFNPQLSLSSALYKTLKQQANQGTIICGIDTGPYIIARAGLLDGYKATIHFEDLINFRQIFPQISTLARRYVIDKKRLTTSGAFASLDLMLELISQQHGEKLSSRIAEQFIYAYDKRTEDSQRLSPEERLETNHPIVIEAVSLMENHLEDNLSTAQIAKLCQISLRQLERLFKTHLQSTPGKWYKLLKLTNARIQLKQSRYNIAEIAANNGFESTSSFSRAYKMQYHQSPSEFRKMINDNSPLID